MLEKSDIPITIALVGFSKQDERNLSRLLTDLGYRLTPDFARDTSLSAEDWPEALMISIDSEVTVDVAKMRSVAPQAAFIAVTRTGLDRRDSTFSFGEVDVTVDREALTPAVVAAVLPLAIGQRRLLADNEVMRDELRRLNDYCHRVATDKTEEINYAKERLNDLFQRVPNLMAAITLEHKLNQAAEALVGPHFFRGAVVYLEDEHDVVIAGRAGDSVITESHVSRYDVLREVLGDQLSTTVFGAANGDANTRDVLVVPVRDHDGKLVGVAELSDGDEVWMPHSETLALIELFLTLVSQSVEQFRLERELEESEALYRSLVDNVGDVIFRFDRDGKLNFISPQISGLLGIHWREVLGTSFFDLIREPDRDELLKVFPYLLAGHSHTRDLAFRVQDGKEVIAFCSLSPVTEHSTITGVLAVARDVTLRRRLEKQIEESEQRYRAFAENANDAIVIIDPDTYKIIDVNPRMLELVGYSREELLHKTVFDIRDPIKGDEVRERIQEVMVSGQGRFEDVPILKSDGSYVFVDTSASVLDLIDKKYYQAILRDISVQKAMTVELKQRVDELQILAEVSDALQSSVDLQSIMGIVLAGVTAGSGLGFNRAFILSYDKARAELRGEAGVGPETAEEAWRIWSELGEQDLTLREMFTQRLSAAPGDLDSQAEYAKKLVVELRDEINPFSEAIRDREAVLVDNREGSPALPRHFVDRYRAPEFAIVPLCTRDDVLGVLLVDNYFTHRQIEEQDLHRLKLFANSAASAFERGRLLVSLERRLHELMLANQHLKESQERLLKTERLTAIGEVAASVAHEIRNPLAAIGGFARSVDASLAEQDRNKPKLKIVIEETERLDVILRSILEFSRPSVPKFVEVDVNGLILQTVHFMDAEIDDRLIQIHYDLEAQSPTVWADEGQIRQVLLNVFRNAIHEMPGGGVLTLATAFEDIMTAITVTDTGPGIPEDQLEKIFEAFYTTRPTGSGLGLSICSQIIRNHNGRIEVSSPPGSGASFKIFLPSAVRGA